MFYHFKIHRSRDGLWAECIELNGCQTQADNKEELFKNMDEVLNLFLSEPLNSKTIFPLPKKKLEGRNIVKISVDSKVALACYLRRVRLQNKISQKEAAKLLGLKNIYSYQRLESPEKANPTLETLAKLKRVFPKFKVDEILC